MRKLVMTVHNIHTWGKPFLTKSGDLDFLESIGLEIARRHGDSTYKLIYGAIHPENLELAKGLYPNAEFIHFSDYTPDENEVLFIPTLDVRGQGVEFKDEFMQMFNYFINHPHIITNINHNAAYYANVMKSHPDFAEIFTKVITTSEMYLKHHDVFEIGGREDDIALMLAVLDELKVERELMQELINFRSHSYYGSEGQLVFYDAYRDDKVLPQLRPEDEILAKPFDVYPSNLTFNRPSDYKGFHLWLDEMLRRPDIAEDSVYICRISMLKSLDSIKHSVSKLGFDFDQFNIYESPQDFFERYHDVKDNGMPNIINSPYAYDDPFFQLLVKAADTYLVCTDYHFITANDYMIFENALVRALQLGLRLELIKPTFKQIVEGTDNQKRLSSNPVDMAETLTSSSLNEQREYVKELLSVSAWVSNVTRYLNRKDV